MEGLVDAAPGEGEENGGPTESFCVVGDGEIAGMKFILT